MNIYEDDLLRLFGSHGFTWTPRNKKSKTFSKSSVQRVLSFKFVTYLLADWFDRILHNHNDLLMACFEIFVVGVRSVQFFSIRETNSYFGEEMARLGKVTRLTLISVNG